MPIRISDYETRTLIEQVLESYIGYLLRTEFQHLTRASYSEAEWLQMLLTDGFRN